MIRPDLFAGILPFVRAAEERSFGRAAASLGVTTAAVSKAVRKLEDDLGVRLLERTSRVVSLTREGEVFLERCQQAVLGVRGARDAMRGIRLEPQGELAVTLPFILASFIVPNLNRLSTQYPRLSFRLDVSDRVAKLAGGGFDVAIRMGVLEDSMLVSRLLRKTRWVTLASPSYLARRATPKTPADLAEHNCLRFVAPDGKARELTFADGGRAIAVRTTGNLLVDQGSLLLAAAESGMGVCQVLDFMIDERVRSGALVEILSAFSAKGPNIHALTTSARATSANVRAFLRFAVDAFARERAP